MKLQLNSTFPLETVRMSIQLQHRGRLSGELETTGRTSAVHTMWLLTRKPNKLHAAAKLSQIITHVRQIVAGLYFYFTAVVMSGQPTFRKW